ncbi:MAG TPA: helix-hairpin-helix domain-containing protein [Candidatus Acidoferrum sp.]|nr:helix-hairpin-helix domain-containing protein [Candidatus Acidoferrum sp.]
MEKTPLTVIPGIGKNMAQHLFNIGVGCVEDLAGADPEELYSKDALFHGRPSDRCVLYVYRCAVYYANTEQRDPELLKWWNWKDRK